MWMCGCVYGCMCVCVYVCMCVCMYVCMYVYVCVFRPLTGQFSPLCVTYGAILLTGYWPLINIYNINFISENVLIRVLFCSL